MCPYRNNIMNNRQFLKYMQYLEFGRPPHEFWGSTDLNQNLEYLEEGGPFDNTSTPRKYSDINNYDQIIYNYSIMRSGSTLLKQIMSEIFDYQKILYFYKWPRFKLFNPPQACHSPIIMTYRDFRDVILSTRRMRLSMHGLTKEESFRHLPTKKEILLLAEREVIPQINGFEAVSTMAKDRILMLRYEDFYGNYDHIFDKFESFFNSESYSEILKHHDHHNGLQISPDMRKRLKLKFSFENNFKKTEAHKNFRSWDTNTKSGLSLHGDHMNSGVLEEWRGLPNDLSSYMTEILYPYLQRWGYEK